MSHEKILQTLPIRKIIDLLYSIYREFVQGHSNNYF